MNINFDFLDSEEFYNSMQRYRHSAIAPQIFVCESFHEIKMYIKTEILKQAVEIGRSLDEEKRKYEDFVGH